MDSDGGLYEIARQLLLTHQLEAELRECGKEGYLLESSGSREKYMDEIDADRAKPIVTNCNLL